MLGTNNAWQAAQNDRELRRRGITVRKMIAGIIAIAGLIATACMEANLPLLFSHRDFLPCVEHIELMAA
jgi:hypothetical protein